MAAEAGQVHRVFVGSMMDIAEKPMPVIDKDGNLQSYTTADIRQKFFDLVPDCPNLLFLLLSKRPGNFNKYIPESWKKQAPENVMFGTSIVNQPTADTLMEQLLQVNGKRFISMEPQLDNVDLRRAYLPKGSLFGDDKRWWLDGIHWVIQGGESGPRKRPFNTDWARFTRDQCKAAGVPYFFKQIDKIQAIPEDLQIREFPEILVH